MSPLSIVLLTVLVLSAVVLLTILTWVVREERRELSSGDERLGGGPTGPSALPEGA